MMPLVLYCKSYSTDLFRVVRLAKSIQQFNIEKLPFYVSVPRAELKLFADHLDGLNVELLADDDILKASARVNVEQVAALPGHLSQQIVKSEFWRLGLSMAYVCLDSDALFIREFGKADFLTPDGTPYTMMDEAHDLMEDAIKQKRPRVAQAFVREADLVQTLFGRQGRRYSFGPFPLVWHREVWQSLDERYLRPKGMSLADAIVRAPIESRWYGEALLCYKAVGLMPCQALFKVYHYAWQYDDDEKHGITHDQLASLYCGVIYQSAWERNMDWPSEGGHWFSRTIRRLRRKLGRI